MTKKYTRFEITEKEIDSALRYLKYEKGEKEATKKDAIALLEDYNVLAHMMAHKMNEDELGGVVEVIKLDEPLKEK
jgi:hypothetical protein